jgi:DNA-binding NtrC family response regulator
MESPKDLKDGNERSELDEQNAVSVLQNLAHELAVAVASLEPGIPDDGSGIDFYAEVRRFESGMIERALEAAGGQQRRAARMLGLKATTLNAKIKIYGIRGSSRRARSNEIALEA